MKKKKLSDVLKKLSNFNDQALNQKNELDLINNQKNQLEIEKKKLQKNTKI